MITKKEISEVLALSCVESYFLAWLQRYYDVRRLYGESFITLKQVFDDFSHGAMYQNYCYIPRLQDVAEEYGVVKHEYHTCSAKEAISILRRQAEADLYLIRVNTAFFTNYKRSSWREDHYICVDQNLKWINQYPLSEGEFTEERFAEIYDGAICCYKLNDSSIDIPDCVKLEYCVQSFDVKALPNSLGDLESAVGILRVSRKRLEKYYESNTRVCALLHEENLCMDKIYFDIHLRALKELRKEGFDRAKAYSELYEKIVEIVELEKNISEALKE